jgi:hypothetical protein
VVAAAAFKTAAATAEARTPVTVATALAMIALFALAIACFVTRNVVANAITPSHLSACDKEGDSKGVS